jgi:hypothetical protein
METAGSSEMLMAVYQTTRQHIPEDLNLYIFRRENFKNAHEVWKIIIGGEEIRIRKQAFSSV